MRKLLGVLFFVFLFSPLLSGGEIISKKFGKECFRDNAEEFTIPLIADLVEIYNKTHPEFEVWKVTIQNVESGRKMLCLYFRKIENNPPVKPRRDKSYTDVATRDRCFF